MKKHPGFKTVSSEISRKERIPKDRANAILASSSRGASTKAKESNKALGKVKVSVEVKPPKNVAKGERPSTKILNKLW